MAGARGSMLGISVLTHNLVRKVCNFSGLCSDAHPAGKHSMSIVASLSRSALVAAVLLVAGPPIVPAAELECADDAVSAHGNGFSPSPEQSAEAAKIEWLKKATAIYSDAKMETAKNPQISCVNQGLYSNCTISAVPCGTTPAAAPKPN